MSRVQLDQAADICRVKPGTIRRWVHDGRLTRHWNGYDFDELIRIRDSRDIAQLAARAGIEHPETISA
jgi:predicted site-specific integrase-resolvase